MSHCVSPRSRPLTPRRCWTRSGLRRCCVAGAAAHRPIARRSSKLYRCFRASCSPSPGLPLSTATRRSPTLTGCSSWTPALPWSRIVPAMTAKLKHIAIVSDNYAIEGKFYEALFGLRTFEKSRPDAAVAVTDGYVGLNVNARKAGRQAGFDHFGFEVEDVEEVFAKSREDYPQVQWLKRPSNRPFAGISMHDPCGNVFDLSQRGMANRKDVYVAEIERTPRRVSHIQLRTVNPELLAQFYTDIFALEEA